MNTRFTMNVKDLIPEILSENYLIIISLYLWKILGLRRLAMSEGVG